MKFSFLVAMSSMLLTSCASSDPYDRPEAYLIVDGKSHEMVSGTSCWDIEGGGKICSDSFAHLTQIEPVNGALTNIGYPKVGCWHTLYT
ncbi:hypothetical protein P886_0780 [Alteromonadaceae bacterium 2753L.S.0a.02]|nr:hypothetical protein P886_0780 [Alteromonadaceae bacterium 2753L.S.0a.02]